MNNNATLDPIYLWKLCCISWCKFSKNLWTGTSIVELPVSMHNGNAMKTKTN